MNKFDILNYVIEENDLAFEHVCMVIGKEFLISFMVIWFKNKKWL